jgi:hypothetical protein
VTATVADRDRPPVELLTAWLEERYRAQAPKTLVKQLDGAAGAGASKSGARTPRRSR